MKNKKEQLRELVTATLVIGAQRGSNDINMDFDKAKELTERHIDSMTDRIYSELFEFKKRPKWRIVLGFISRILASPFTFGILLIAYIRGFLTQFIMYLRYGGEWITYFKRSDPETISSLYKELKKQNEKP
jgi:hypothetical protein